MVYRPKYETILKMLLLFLVGMGECLLDFMQGHVPPGKKKWCDLVHSECSKVRYYEPKINNFKDNKRALGPLVAHMRVTVYKGIGKKVKL